MHPPTPRLESQLIDPADRQADRCGPLLWLRSFGCELKSGGGYPALCARAADLENPLPRLWRLEPATCRPVLLVRRCRALPGPWAEWRTRRPREGARLGANASALRGNAARVRWFRGCDILVERDHRRRPVLGTSHRRSRRGLYPLSPITRPVATWFPSWSGNSPPRTDTPSDVIVTETESDAARMSGWARGLGAIQIPARG